MEVAKLKVELYDIAAIVVPGIFCIAEIWAALFGTQSLLRFVHDLKGTELTLIVLCSFAAGNLVQEAGNRLLTAWKGKRFFKEARDKFWQSAEGEFVRSKIKNDGACELGDVDSAFEYCLTRIGGKFLKRDVFLAISDFSRSLWLLSWAASLPLARVVISRHGLCERIAVGLAFAGLIVLISWLSWVRMLRFRAMSETPVFNTFLACGATSEKAPNQEKDENE